MDKWLTGYEVMSRLKVDKGNLVQHIVDGLPVYDDETLIDIKQTRLRGEVFFYLQAASGKPYAGFKPEELRYRVHNCLFKSEDVEEFERKYPELAKIAFSGGSKNL